MAGETLKTEAVCLRIYPWSRTSHIVHWLTPHGRLATVVKGATRPKSAFLGQYDLNYTCEIVYYLGSRGDLHALRECSPEIARASLRGNLAALLLADHMRSRGSSRRAGTRRANGSNCCRNRSTDSTRGRAQAAAATRRTGCPTCCRSRWKHCGYRGFRPK